MASSLRKIKQWLGKRLIPLLPVTRHVFDHLRYEHSLFWVRCRCRFSPIARLRLNAMYSKRDLSVNIAPASNGLSGWTNIEGFPHSSVSFQWDCRRQLPFGNSSCARIYCEHFFEHLDHVEEVPSFLRECHRVMRPGATLRLVVPDAGRYLRAYAEADWKGMEALGWRRPLPDGFRTKLDILNHVFRQGHEHMYAYDQETLTCDLEEAGFKTVVVQAFRQSTDPLLEIDQEHHRPYSLYLEAVK